jgi:hypothetical protein
MTERQNNSDLRPFSLKMLPIRQASKSSPMDDHSRSVEAVPLRPSIAAGSHHPPAGNQDFSIHFVDI